MAGKNGQGKGGRAMVRPNGGSSAMAPVDDDQDFDTLAGQAENYDEGGTTNKSVLEGVDMVITACKFQPSQVGDGDFAVVTCKTKEHGKVTFTDSGKGVCEKLREYMDKGGSFPLRVRNGLKKNTYISQVTGKEATTYWLNGGMNDADAAAVTALGKSSVGGKVRESRARG